MCGTSTRTRWYTRSAPPMTPPIREEFFSRKFDYIVDCIDLVSRAGPDPTGPPAGHPRDLSALGTGNKLEPELLRARYLQDHGRPLARGHAEGAARSGIHHLKVVFSLELPHETQQLEAPSPGRRSVPRQRGVGTPVAGLMMGGTVVYIEDGGLVP